MYGSIAAVTKIAFVWTEAESAIACVYRAFPCGFGAKNEERETKSARKMAQVGMGC